MLKNSVKKFLSACLNMPQECLFAGVVRWKSGYSTDRISVATYWLVPRQGRVPK